MSLKDLQSLIMTPTMSADAIMRCALGVKTAEIEAYCSLITVGSATVHEIAEGLGKSRSTAQRLLQNLVEKGLALREERLIGLGGYRYVYSAVPPERMREAIKDILVLYNLLTKTQKIKMAIEPVKGRNMAIACMGSSPETRDTTTPKKLLAGQ